MKQPVYNHIARLLDAFNRCQETNNPHADNHKRTILKLVENHMPSGSGVDNGTHLDFEESTPNKLVFLTDFHHMDEHGYYNGWTEHKVIVTPSLMWGFDLKITGKDRNAIKEYLADLFSDALNTQVDPWETIAATN